MPRRCTPSWSASSTAPTGSSTSTAAASTSTSATASWRSSARPSPTATMPSGRCGPRWPSATRCRAVAARGRAAVAVHIGVASGEVVASGTGSATHREYTVTGESVNLAARLTDAAPAGRDPGLGRGAAGAGRPARLRGGRTRSRSRVFADAGAGLAPARPARAVGLGRRPLVGRDGELGQFRGVARGLPRERARPGRPSCAARPASARRAWSRSSRTRPRGAGFACHVGLVLDFGAGTGRDAVRTLVRGLLGLDAHRRRAPRRRQRDGRSWPTASCAEADAVFLNDLLDLPQPVELRALYDAMDNASAQPRQARDRGAAGRAGERPHAAAARRRGRALGGPADAGATGRASPRPWPRCPARPGHDLADRGRSARPGLARRGRRRPAPDDRSRPAATGGGAGAGRPFLARRRPSPSAASSGPPATRSSSSSSCATPRRARRPACPARCRASSWRGWIGSTRPTRPALQAASVLGQRFDAGRSAPSARTGPATSPTAGRARLLSAAGRGLPVRPRADPGRGLRRPARGAGGVSCTDARRTGSRTRDPVLRAEHLDRAEDPEAPRAYLAAARAQAPATATSWRCGWCERGLALARERADRFALGLLPGRHPARPGRHAAAASRPTRARWPRRRTTPSVPAPGSAWPRSSGSPTISTGPAPTSSGPRRRGRARARAGAGADPLPARQSLLSAGDIDGCLREHGRASSCARRARPPELEAARWAAWATPNTCAGRMISAHDRFAACVELAAPLASAGSRSRTCAQIAHAIIYSGRRRGGWRAGLAAPEPRPESATRGRS